MVYLNSYYVVTQGFNLVKRYIYNTILGRYPDFS